MAITVSLLGTPTFTTASGTKTVTTTPAVGDLIVIVTANSGSTTTTAAPTDNNSGGSGTYTVVNTAVKATSADTMQVWVRDALITSATSTVFTQAPGTTSGGGLVVIVCKGMDKAGSSAVVRSAIQSNIASGTPAPVLGATPSSANAIIGAVFNASNPAALTQRTGYTEIYDSGYNNPTTGLEVMYRNSGETSATITWGSTSPSAFASIALELNSLITHATTGTLTGQIGSVVGSAQRNATHTSTGTLTGQGSSVVGSADRQSAVVAHTATGTLTGQSAVIVGSADSSTPRSSSGVLVGQGSTIVGSADRQALVIPHTSTGVLVGQGSTIVGSSTRYRAFATSGTLSGQVAIITGDADHVSNTHDSSGDIVGPGAVITGDADNPNNAEAAGGGKKTRQSRKPQVVVVEVDGKEYRVPVAQLNSFLEAIKTEAKQEVKQTTKKSKKKQKIVELISEPYVKIEIKSVPAKLIPEVYKKVENINTEIHSIFYVAMQKYIRDMEEEEEELLFLSL
jgi:hypothetical protein